MIEVVDLEQIRQAVSWKAALSCVEAGLLALARGEVTQPPPFELLVPGEGDLHVKGGTADGSPWIVLKVATGAFAAGPPSGCLLLLDAATGQLRALLDDRGYLTDVRTAAAAALATRRLAAEGARETLVIGGGQLAPSLVAALRAHDPDAPISLWARRPERMRELCSAHGLQPVTDLEQAVRSARAVITATTSRTPLLDAEWVAPGTHVTALGADTAGKRELPPGLLERADLVVCDDVPTAARAGELQHCSDSLRARAVSWPQLLLDGTWRRGPDEVTVADLCGIGAEDVAIAAEVVEALGIRASSGAAAGTVDPGRRGAAIS